MFWVQMKGIDRRMGQGEGWMWVQSGDREVERGWIHVQNRARDRKACSLEGRLPTKQTQTGRRDKHNEFEFETTLII